MKRHLHFIPVLLIAVASLLSCGNKKVACDHESAQRAAEECYQMLIDSNYAGFIDLMIDVQEMPASQRQEMIDLTHQFAHDLQEQHGGILSIKATNDNLVDTLADVFLNIQFCDSIQEQILLPMVYTQGKWWMR